MYGVKSGLWSKDCGDADRVGHNYIVYNINFRDKITLFSSMAIIAK